MKPSAIIGAGLLGLGLLLLVTGNFTGAGSIIQYFWPTMFILPVSILLHVLYFRFVSNGGSGLLIPGGILLTVAVVCQISMLFNAWEYMWPGFILAPAVGLLEFYWFGYRNRWLLLPIGILSSLSAIFFIVFSLGYILRAVGPGQPYIAVVLVIAGAALLLLKRKPASRF